MRYVLVAWCPNCGSLDMREADGPGGLAQRCVHCFVIAEPIEAVQHEVLS